MYCMFPENSLECKQVACFLSNKQRSEGSLLYDFYSRYVQIPTRNKGATRLRVTRCANYIRRFALAVLGIVGAKETYTSEQCY